MVVQCVSKGLQITYIRTYIVELAKATLRYSTQAKTESKV